MKRTYNTDESTLEISSEVSYNCELVTGIKPAGLWYAINNEWLEWCYSEMPEWIKKYLFELEIDTSEILIISDIQTLTLFVKKYSDKSNHGLCIKWDKVKRDYKGIEIINYYELKKITSFDIDFIWFYSWDVNSGCIWDVNILKGFKRMNTPKKWLKNEHQSTNQRSI